MAVIAISACRKIEDYRQAILHAGGEVRVVDPSMSVEAALAGIDGVGTWVPGPKSRTSAVDSTGCRANSRNPRAGAHAGRLRDVEGLRLSRARQTKRCRQDSIFHKSFHI